MRRPSYILILICLVLIGSPVDGYPDQLTGKVVEVYSGDTIGIIVDGVPVRIHLYGIECLDKEQPFGREAEERTFELIFGKVVTVQVTNIDHRGEKTG